MDTTTTQADKDALDAAGLKIDPSEKQTKTFKLDQVKAIDEGNGGFTAYVTTWGNVDRGSERVVKGSVTESLETFMRDGWLAVGHNWYDMGVGFIKSYREDDYGLWVEFAFHGDDDAQVVRKRVLERIAAGKTVSVSIGYYLRDWKVVEGVLELHKIDLMEVSIVNVPMNPLAIAVGAKNLDDVPFAEEGAVVVTGMKHWADRIEQRILSRIDRKAGAELSSANVALIDSVVNAIDQLIESKSKLQELADRNRKGTESEPDQKTLETEALAKWNAERSFMLLESHLYC